MTFISYLWTNLRTLTPTQTPTVLQLRSTWQLFFEGHLAEIDASWDQTADCGLARQRRFLDVKRRQKVELIAPIIVILFRRVHVWFLMFNIGLSVIRPSLKSFQGLGHRGSRLLCDWKGAVVVLKITNCEKNIKKCVFHRSECKAVLNYWREKRKKQRWGW